MHSTAGSPTEPSFVSKNTERSEQHEKIEKAKLASTTRSRSSQSSLLPPDLPPALAAQLVTISSPQDLLSAHIVRNDRRLRRLLCRYTNQIKYGCKNPHCAVPSCLTCRQRKSKTPVRKYTDASARALASHIIDEQGEKGLCQSEPVVPWFESPGSRSRTRSGEPKSRPHGHVKESANGHSVGPANGHLRHPDLRRSPIRSHARPQSPRQPSDVQSSADPAAKTVDLSRKKSLDESVIVPHVSAPAVEQTPSRFSRRDTRSFTRAVFDSLGLRSLWINPDTRVETSALDVAASHIPDAAGSYENHTSHEDSGSIAQQDGESKLALTEKQVLAQEASSEDGTKLPSWRCNEIHSQSPRDTQGECLDLTQAVALPKSFSPNHQSEESLTIGGSDILHRRTHSTDQEAISHARHDGRSTAQVVPFLPKDLLEFFMRHRVSALLDQQSWPELGASEPYGHFVRNTVFFCLRDPWRILKSMREWHEADQKVEVYDSNALNQDTVKRGIICITKIVPVADICRALRLGLTDAYNTPLTWRSVASRRTKREHNGRRQDDDSNSSAEDSGQSDWLSDEDTARICAFGLLILERKFASLHIVSFRQGLTPALEFVQICNSFGRVFPEHRLAYIRDRSSLDKLSDSLLELRLYQHVVGRIIDLIDYFDDYDAKRLFSRITELIATRHAFREMSKSRRKPSLSSPRNTLGVAALIASHLTSYTKQIQGESISINANILTLEWIKLLFAREWDGNPVVRRASPLGGSLQLLQAMFTENSNGYAMDAKHFYIPFLAERLDMVQMPVEWLSFRADNKKVHLLSYSFLFEPQVLVSSFRAINYSRMSKAAIDARAVQKDVRDFTDSSRYPGAPSGTSLLTSLRPYMANNFVITIRREKLLQDAVDQIWRRQRRELMRPLKVRMGMDEGEQGIDIGGVQQEFFRILFAQALDPAYAMFTIDERTRMTWFKPGALEPLYKFEVLGVFMSLAVYNSITLPVTFPLAFYRKLLGLKVKKVHQIADGWPELAIGLQQMLDWSDGDVGDVFARTYEFSYEAFGKHVNIDMKKFDRNTPWPPVERKKGKEKAKTASFELPPSSEDDQTLQGSLRPEYGECDFGVQSVPLKDNEEAPLVTNADREQYVKDYIVWLTHRSIESQFKAFSRGFYTCLDRTALSIFTPEALKAVIEGHQHIDLEQLETATKYEDGFDESSLTIQDFWQIVRNFSTDQHRRLLEFVTASDRVPVNGIKSVQFIVQRNGSGDERLPTSMTCFGRLLLPQYSSRQVLEEKLTKAIENSEGFGVA